MIGRRWISGVARGLAISAIMARVRLRRLAPSLIARRRDFFGPARSDRCHSHATCTAS